MKKNGRKFKVWVSVLIWLLALAVTLLSAIYQRKSGPTHPHYGEFSADNQVYSYKLVRDPTTDAPLQVAIPLPPHHQAVLHWREYPTDWPWKSVEMTIEGDHCSAVIPVQPSAGKIEYFVAVSKLKIPGSEQTAAFRLPQAMNTAIARYKDPVPAWALIPHILLMFVGMLLANRLGLGVIFHEKNRPDLIMATFFALTVGGLVFGPIVQKYAFGAAWTGWPVGHDLTDNKMLISWAVWIVPVVLALKKKKTQIGVLIAVLVTFAVYMIPHSVLGSEYDYSNKSTSSGVSLNQLDTN